MLHSHRRFASGQLKEDFFEAHRSWPKLIEVPARFDHGPRQVASHEASFLALHFEDHAAIILALATSFAAAASGSAPALTGSVLVLIQFDVADEIRLDQLQQIINSRTVQQPSLKHAAPAYVRYQRPPVVVAADPLVLDSGEQLTGEIKYYDYGVVSILYQLPFSGDWDSLVHLSSRWVWDVDFAMRVEPVVRQKLERVPTAMIKPYERWLSEDYFIFHVRESPACSSAADLELLQGPAIRC